MKKSNSQKINLLITFTITLILAACGNEIVEKKNTEKKDTVKKVVKVVEPPPTPVDTFYNSITQLIGGNDSLITKISGKWDMRFIKEFSRDSRLKFEKIKNERLEKISVWNKEIMERNTQSDSSFAFYPFSGGDFIHLNFLYPNAKEYFMVAREPVGDFPDLMSLDSFTVNKYLKNIDVVLRDIYYRSYFITKNMLIDIEGKNLVNGMFPLIMWAVSRTSHEILSVKFGVINDSGKIDFKSKDDFKKTKPDAVEISIRKFNSKTIKKITYLSCDISDQGLTNKPKFYNYLQTKLPDTCISFIKSASYLLHYVSFSKIRNMIRSKSDYLVQDDTGIPFKEFNIEKWKSELYGVYTHPVDDFKSSMLFQRDLDSAYKNEKFYRGELSFSLGYHWSSKKQNEMVFKKIK